MLLLLLLRSHQRPRHRTPHGITVRSRGLRRRQKPRTVKQRGDPFVVGTSDARTNSAKQKTDVTLLMRIVHPCYHTPCVARASFATISYNWPQGGQRTAEKKICIFETGRVIQGPLHGRPPIDPSHARIHTSERHHARRLAVVRTSRR